MDDEAQFLDMPILSSDKHSCLRCNNIAYVDNEDESGFYCTFYNDMPFIRNLSIRRVYSANNCENFDELCTDELM